MELVRSSWLELWRRNRSGGILTLAFWYTLITTLYQYLVAARLGPDLPKELTRLINHPAVIRVMPHLAPALWVKLGLVYATFLLVILPFAVGGLYGGVASAIRDTPDRTSFVAFFKYGYRNFWRALAQVVLAVIYAAIVVGIVTGLFLALSAVGPGGPVAGIIAVIVGAAGMLWLVGTALYWFGQTFASSVSPVHGWPLIIRWGARHVGRLMSSTILLVAALLVTLFVTTLLASLIPVLGEVVLVLVLGMIMPAYLATYAVVLYQQYPPS